MMSTSDNPHVDTQKLTLSPKRITTTTKRQRRGNEFHSAKENRQPIDYDSLGIPEAAVPSFEETREMFTTLGRKRTEEVFICGEMLANVRSQSPSQKVFERWSKQACRLTRRGAGNYIAVHNNLRAHRQALIECSMPAAAMYTLATADQEIVVSVIAGLKDGKRPTASELKALICGEGGITQLDAADTAGAQGLKALARAKIRNALPILIGRLTRMLEDIDVALKPHFEGKRVAKGALATKLEHPARRARGELQSLAVFVEPNSESSETWRVHPARFPPESRWDRVDQLLFKLGGREGWPDVDDLGAWLVNDVVPTIEFAVGAKHPQDASLG
jgi:hypothetical protein